MNDATAYPDLLCLGEAMVEFNQTDPADPTRWRRGFGGDTSNCAIAAARMGASVGYLSAVGADAFGAALLDLWRGEGVDVRGVARSTSAPTGVYFVTHGPKGHEFTYLRAGSAAARQGPADLPVAMLDRARALHLSGISQAISNSACDTGFAAMARVRAAGGLVSYDTNLRLRLWPLDRARAIIDAAAARADLLFASLDDVVQLTGLDDPERIARHYLALGARTVLVKCGADGAWLADGTAWIGVPPIKVAAVDATGAGDVFAGAFLARILAGESPARALVWANAAAGLSTTGFGAVAPIPTRDQVAVRIAADGA